MAVVSWLRARALRIRQFGRLVVGLIVTSVALATAVAFWWSKLGLVAFAILAAIVVAVLLLVVTLPQDQWARLAGVDQRAEVLAARLNGATFMRHEFFANKPPAATMTTEFVAWYEETRVAATSLGARYAADLQAAVLSSPPAGDYAGSGLNADQQKVVRRLDVMIECLRGIIRQLH